MQARTFTHDRSLNSPDHSDPTLKETRHTRKRILDSLSWYAGRLNLLTGIASLGAATVIFALSKKRVKGGNAGIVLRMVPLVLATFSSFAFSNLPKKR